MPPWLFPATIALCLSQAVTGLGCTVPDDAQNARANVLRQINAERRSAGRPALAVNDRLQTTAQRHACDMAAAGEISHIGRDGSDLAGRLRRAGYRFRAANENVAALGSSNRVVALWMASSGHRANILQGTVREIGVGVAVGANRRVYWATVSGAAR